MRHCLDLPSARRVIADLEYQGYAVIERVLTPNLLERTRRALYTALDQIRATIGVERLARAGELGVVRNPFAYDETFFRFLELDIVLQLTETLVGDGCILHLMNGFVLPPLRNDDTKAFQLTFHRDFPRFLDGYRASINLFFAIDEFTVENGATLVVPGTHQRAGAPDEAYMRARAIPIQASAGSLLVFDSTLWHAAGQNTSRGDRLALNLQFTKSFIKQQIDYVRALGDDTITSLPEKSQQLLGWYTRVVTSLEDYYVPEEQRLYRRGQG